jgi:hypothetical protein
MCHASCRVLAGRSHLTLVTTLREKCYYHAINRARIHTGTDRKKTRVTHCTSPSSLLEEPELHLRTVYRQGWLEFKAPSVTMKLSCEHLLKASFVFGLQVQYSIQPSYPSVARKQLPSYQKLIKMHAASKRHFKNTSSELTPSVMLLWKQLPRVWRQQNDPKMQTQPSTSQTMTSSEQGGSCPCGKNSMT